MTARAIEIEGLATRTWTNDDELPRLQLASRLSLSSRSFEAAAARIVSIIYRANKINPKFVSLFDSRGIETLEHKLFMRTTGTASSSSLSFSFFFNSYDLSQNLDLTGARS